MSGDTAFVFTLVAVTAVLMASNRVRFDFIALLVMLALMLSGVLSPAQALSGFGNPVVILVAGLLVVGEALDRTGVASAVGDWILKKGGSSEARLMVVVMAAAGVLGSVMSSTAVVAIFIPIVLRIAAETGHDASRMLMPMSYAALISGMLTLIATTPNLVVHQELRDAGFEGFGFFSFAPVGLAVLVVAIVYVLIVGRRLLPKRTEAASADRARRSIEELWDDFRVDRRYESRVIGPDSPLADRTIAESDLENRYGVRVIGIARGEQRIPTPESNAMLLAGDTLLIGGLPESCERMAAENGLALFEPSSSYRRRWLWELGAVAVLIHPESVLIGKTVSQSEFRTRYGLEVFGLRRRRKPVADYTHTRFAAGDSLLVVGAWSDIKKIASRHHDFVVLETPAEQDEIVPASRQMTVALAILVGMVLLTVLDLVPLVAAVIMAALAAVVTRCLTMEDSYRAIHWSSLVLVAGMLPLADALESTGGTTIVVDALMDGIGERDPRLMLTAIFFLTAVLGLFLSNTASAVLVAPIAIVAADTLAVSPYPFAIAVLIAASAAFSTPVSTPVVTLVVEPGRYRFMDFVKVGLPLLVLTYVVTLLTAPLLYPFGSR